MGEYRKSNVVLILYMATQKIKPTTIEEYIDAAPAAVQEKL
jgi:hypothetical protein